LAHNKRTMQHLTYLVVKQMQFINTENAAVRTQISSLKWDKRLCLETKKHKIRNKHWCTLAIHYFN